MPDTLSQEQPEQKVKNPGKRISGRSRLKDGPGQSRETDHAILDTIVEGYYEVDLKGNFVFFNRAMQDMLGFEKDEMPGINNRAYMDKKTAAKVFKAFHSVFLTGEPLKSLGCVLIRKDNTRRHVETSVILIRDSKNNPRGFRGVVRDVTGIRRVERALQEREAQYRSLADNTPDLLYRTDMEGAIVLISSSVYRLSGYTVEEALGMNIAREIYAFPDEQQSFLDLIKKNGRVKNFETRLKRKDGSLWWASTNARFYKDTAGRISGVEGIARDISDQKQIEAALRESETKFRTAFMASPDSINLNRVSDGLYLDINNGFTDIMGYTREEVLLKTSVELNIWADVKDRELMVHQLKTKGVVKNFEAKFRSKDGTIKTGLMSAHIIRINREDIILSVVRDITEQKRTREVLIQSEKMLSVGGLAAGMAHEINNPLAGIIQNAQVIANRMSTALPANRKAAEKIGIQLELLVQYMEERKIFDLISSMREAGNRAAKIVANILSFSRKSDDSSFFKLNIKELMENTLEIAENDYDLKKKTDFRNVLIVREYDDADFYVECNGSSIQQVILNILRNAAEALFEKEMTRKPRILIRITGEKNGGRQVRIEIKDNGPGMTENVLKRIFEPFFTTKPVGLGTGLGLSVSYFIITETHKGRIFAESAPGEGTTFIITLPVTPDESRENEPDQTGDSGLTGKKLQN